MCVCVYIYIYIYVSSHLLRAPQEGQQLPRAPRGRLPPSACSQKKINNYKKNYRKIQQYKKNTKE